MIKDSLGTEVLSLVCLELQEYLPCLNYVAILLISEESGQDESLLYSVSIES